MVWQRRRLSQSFFAASGIREHPSHGRGVFENAGRDALVRCIPENSAVYERRHSYVLHFSGNLPRQQIGPLLDAGCLCVAVGRVVFFYHSKISSPIRQRASHHRLNRLLSDRDHTHDGLDREIP